MKRFAVILAVLTAIGVPLMAQDRLIMNAGGTELCASQTYSAGGPTTTFAGFSPTSFSLSGALTGIGSAGPGATGVNAELKSLKFSTLGDECGEQLIADFLNKTALPTVTITLFRPNVVVGIYPSLKITLSSAYIASWTASQEGGADSGNTFTLIYTNICYSFTPVNANGTLRAPLQVCHSAPASMAP
jgi:type VI protein secretion system component Hcp